MEDAPRVDVIIANLFLHHFEPEKLSLLLKQSAAKTKVFVACEPRRSTMGIFVTRFLCAIGCNDVTRHDARASVCADFCSDEISQVWPRNKNWEIKESQSGLFSHSFVAVRAP